MQKVLDFSNVLHVILAHETIVFLVHSQTASKHINRSNFQSINFNSLVYKHLVLLLNNAQINYAFSIIIEKVEKINWIPSPTFVALSRACLDLKPNFPVLSSNLVPSRTVVHFLQCGQGLGWTCRLFRWKWTWFRWYENQNLYCSQARWESMIHWRIAD